MAQAFVSTNKNHFRWNTPEKTLPINPDQNLPDCNKDQDFWLVVEDLVKDERDDESFAKVVAAVNQMQLKRMISTYQRDYCRDNIKIELDAAVRYLNTQNLHLNQPYNVPKFQIRYTTLFLGQSLSKQEQESLGNELLESCKLLYDRKFEKVLPPLPSTRKISGYIRPTRLFTPFTVYQKDIGSVGFEILKQ